MLKLCKKANLADFERQAEAVLRELLGRVPFLRIDVIQRVSHHLSDCPGWLVKVETGAQPWRLLVEGRQQGQRRDMRNGVLVLHRFLEQTEKPCYGILVAPFVSAESAQLCTEAGLGYFDLAGNARLSFAQVFIERQAAGNPFREKRQLKSLFTAKAGRLLRVLLTPPLRAWKVVELAKAAGVSLGQASNVRKLLLDGDWAVVGDAGLRLSRPEALARAWQDAYEPRPLSRTTAYTLLHDEELDGMTRAALAEAGEGAHAVLASYSAATWLAPYARQATRFFYADKPGTEILRRRLQLQPMARGENVVILEPREDDVFAGRVEAAPGIWCSGLVQTWLDLGATGERGGEAAEHLLQEKLLPAWQQGAGK